MHVLNRILSVFLCLLILFLPLTGCSNFKTSVSVTAIFLTSVHLNPNSKGESSPIVVHYYELTSPTAFESGDYFSLTTPESTSFGHDLLYSDEITLFPAEEKEIKRRLNPATRYLGFVAGYREIADTRWKAVVPIRASFSAKYLIRLSKDAITVSRSADNDEDGKDLKKTEKFNF